ncbi:MAG: hypothetical protein JWN34_4852 [Bryobacterales bacterium]|nr:hypothetical protein [Bryobacterales bacterium]
MSLRLHGVRSGWLNLLVPSLPEFAFLTPILFIFGRMNGAHALLGDADTGWHIRAGEWILENRRVPTQDIFSFTRASQPWFAWEWLSDVCMALLHYAGGLPAIVIAAMLLLGVTVLLLFRLVLRHCQNPAIAFAVTVIAAASSSIHWLARPHLFTLLFVVIFYGELGCGESGRPRRSVLFLPALMVLWTNLHGGFFIGIVMVCAWAVQGWAAALLSTGAPRLSAMKRGNSLACVALACLAASFANPYTWRLHEHLFDYLTHPGYFLGIQEFLPISPGHPLARFYEVLLFFAPAAAIWQLWRGRYAAFIQTALWMHLSLSASRNIPVFAMLVAPSVGEALTSWLRCVRVAVEAAWARRLTALAVRMSFIVSRAGMQGRFWLLSGAVVLFLFARMHDPAAARIYRAEFDPAVYPEEAIGRLRAADRVFTDDEWGDYLIFRCYPAGKVFIDGRSDFYGPAFEDQYRDVLNARSSWQGTLDDHRVDTLLVRTGSPLSEGLRSSRIFSLAYGDKVALIFRRNTAF